MAIELQHEQTPMQQRKSRPKIEGAPQLHVIPRSRVGENDRTLVQPMKMDKLPTPPEQFAVGTDHHKQSAAPTAPVAKPAPVAAPNIIPFARPRAIAAMPATFSKPAPQLPAPKTPPPQVGSWNRSPQVAQPAPAPVAPPPAPTQAPTVAPPSPTLAQTLIFNPAPPLPEARSPLPAAPDAPKTRPSWSAFEKLGLLRPKLDPKKLSKHVVTAYRMLGFGILTIIVFVLIGYIATTAFFYMSDSWIVPMAVNPTDEKVVALEAQLAERQNNRDRLAADLDDANRAIAMQKAYQGEFEKAIQSDLSGRKAALERMHELANAAASTRASIRHSNDAFTNAAGKRMAEEYKAGLIDRQGMLTGKLQLAQITSSSLSLKEHQAEYEVRAADLEAQTRSLEALLANAASDSPISYDVLKIKQEYEASRLATDKATGLRDALKLALDREDKLLATLKQTSYLRAIADHAQVAFVPYGNMHTVDRGTSLYGCKLGMVICHKVGTVLEILPGEVQFKHPHRDKMLRGQMVELKLEDAANATDDVLFVGGRPLLI
jgi:hypothetical protein